MDHSLQHFALWSRTLAPTDQPDPHRERLRTALDKFRSRVAQLVQSLGAEVPGLTVHDITHLDALWRVADQIMGSDYPINPAEAFVFGGAVLLHDAAHVIAAYPGGLTGIKDTIQWQDLIAQQYGNNEPPANSTLEKAAIFQVLRQLHAEQAHKLPMVEWAIPGTTEKMHLLEDLELRLYYGDLIGEIAESHHWSVQRVVDVFGARKVAPPSFLNTSWTVDAIKIALLLRVSDAAHLDDQRAPWFLFALGQPTGISAEHWRFQAKIGQPICDASGQLLLTAGAPFNVDEKNSWWLAYDTACMVDRELKDAASILSEEGKDYFRATGVMGVESPTTFSRYVRVSGWEPVNIAPKVSNLPSLIRSLGGVALYGNNLRVPLREILQNSIDAVHAARRLKILEESEGYIEVSLKRKSEISWTLQVTDTGIGMSRFVLTSVLLDFGKSLWKSDSLREELPGLAKTGFRATGQFGVGFYSIFMLGDQIQITTKRFEKSDMDSTDQWSLIFESGLNGRPVLTKATGNDKLAKHGTRISVEVSTKNIYELFGFSETLSPWNAKKAEESTLNSPEDFEKHLARVVALLCPASDVRVRIRTDLDTIIQVIEPNDWLALSDNELCSRIGVSQGKLFPLYNDEGNIIGRISPLSSAYDESEAFIVYNGIACGRIDGMRGICEASNNNSDAKRVNAQVGGSREQWSAWAKRVIAGTERIPYSVYLRLHRLLPDKDFPLWFMGKQQMTLARLMSEIKELDLILVHEGEIDYDSYDDSYLSPNSFENHLSILPMVVSYPKVSLDPFERISMFERKDDFSWVSQWPKIDYEEMLVARLKREWGGVEVEEEDFEIVGDVEGAEIERVVLKMQRKKNED